MTKFLGRVNKGETSATTREALDKLAEAGIKRSVMLINGLGGEKFSRPHAAELGDADRLPLSPSFSRQSGA